jgi:hypothetical protein
LGKNEFNSRKPLMLLAKNLVGECWRFLKNSSFEAKAKTYSSGVYNRNERKTVRHQYATCFLNVSRHGCLALYTVVKPKFYVEQYLPKLFDFFAVNSIAISKHNYVPFYFVYILLTNKKYSGIYKDRTIHLITSFDRDRKAAIEKTLFSFGVKAITWSKISQDKSLFDVLDVHGIPPKVELIFVGAGVGKVNIFNQLAHVTVPVIDAGYVFETWQNPALNSQRDYCSVSEKEVISS